MFCGYMLKPRSTTHHCEVTADVLDEDEILRNLRPAAPRRLHRSIFALTRVKLGADLETQVGQVQLREDSGDLEVVNVFTLNRRTCLFTYSYPYSILFSYSLTSQNPAILYHFQLSEKEMVN